MNWVPPAAPHCPACQAQMSYTRKIAGMLAFPDLFVFLCHECSMAETLEGAAVSARPSAAD